MFRLINLFLFTSLDKCCGDGFFSSDNGTCIFWEYIGFGTFYSIDIPALGSL